ncbi:MAG TPA: hypothetical protein VHC73_03310 [Vitreimonas sp.]|jgi:hypothetical protein|nr:hypothetical protein [Vitreimonas sp.]
MGSGKADAEIAKVLARHAEIQARREKCPALLTEWRWSRSGWGGWNALPSSLRSIALSGDEPTETNDEATKK